MLRTELTCDPAKTAEPTSSNWSVTYTDCGYTVTGSHAAGCGWPIPIPVESNAEEKVPTFRSTNQLGSYSAEEIAAADAARTVFPRRNVSFTSARKIGGNVEGYYGLEWVFGADETNYSTTFRSGKIQGRRDKSTAELLNKERHADD